MSLWMLLTLLAGASAFGGALAAALPPRRGISTVLVAAAAGVFLGAAAKVISQFVGMRVLSSTHADGVLVKPARLRVLYAGTALWVLVAAYLANFLTRFLVEG